MSEMKIIGLFILLLSMDKALSLPLPEPKKPDCVEGRGQLIVKFIGLDFGKDRSTTGRDQVEPLKTAIEAALRDREIVITDVTILSSSSRAPFYTTLGGKKVLDPKSDEINLRLTQERAEFAEKAVMELRPAHSSLKNVHFEFKAQLSGPAFEPKDLNDRFVTNMTPGYLERLEALHKKYKKDFEETALIPSAKDLHDSNQSMNLYQAKFRPFHGFKLVIRGYRKEEMKCLSIGAEDEAATTSKQ